MRQAGCDVRRLPEAPELPDAVFVEDTAVVLDELAVATNPGAASRRPEVDSVAAVLAAFRPLARIEPPATLDGGDVLRVGRVLYVGASSRSNDAGRAALWRLVEPFGYRVEPVPLRGCLHLKTAVTEVAPNLLLLNPDWVDAAGFTGCRTIGVDAVEPFAANALRIGERVIVSVAHPRTATLLRRAGIDVDAVDMTETEKAEGGVTCCSVVFDAH